MINEKFEQLCIRFRGRPTNGSMADVQRPRILISFAKFRTSGGLRPSFTATTDFRCCNRSRDVGRTSIVSRDLQNVCLALGIFQLSFRVLELVILRCTAAAIYFWCSYTLRNVGHTSVVSGDIINARLAFGIFLLSLDVANLVLLTLGDSHIFDFCKSCRITYFSYSAGPHGLENTISVVRSSQIQWNT